MTRTQQIAYNAALKSSGPLLDDISKRLIANDAVAGKAGASFNAYGMSAKQTAAALRGVPAQVTDIVTALQGGQRPMTVLIQQGGQLKDMFGGVVPAAQALTSTLIGMINPATLSAAALAALAAAYYKGSIELDAFQKNAIMTGNALGLTIDRVSAMSQEMADMARITEGEAASALTEVAKSGKIAAGQIEAVATIAARSAKLLGKDTSETVREFAKLADEPAKASAELNRQYHYLTASTYEQIKALEEQGRTQDAARLAQEAYATATSERLDEVASKLGTLERAWMAVAGAAGKAWDAMLDVGRPETISEEIARLEKELAAMASVGPFSGGPEFGFLSGDEAKVTAIKDRLLDLRNALAAQDFTAGAKAWAADENQKRIDALDEWGKLTERNLSKQAQMEKDIVRIRETGVAAGRTELEIEAAIAAYRAKNAEKGRAGKKRDIPYESLDDLIASPRVQKSLSDLERQYASISNLIGDRLTTAQQKYTRELEAMGQSDWARRVNAELQSIQDKYNNILEQRRTSAEGLSEQDERALRDAMDREMQMAARHYAALDSLQDDWLLGASKGLADYADQATNVYQSMGDLATQSFQGMSDALTDFVMTGKANFSDLADSIIRDMVRIAIQKAILGPLASSLGGGLAMFGAEMFANMSSDPIGSLIGSLGGAAYNAKGGVYDSPSLSAYSNQIHDKPKFFEFAKGAGVFAEAGPEAIMPLKRGPDGTLGVKAHGSDSTQPAPMKIEIINQSSTPVRARDGGVSFDGKEFVQSVILDDLRLDGPIARNLKSGGLWHRW